MKNLKVSKRGAYYIVSGEFDWLLFCHAIKASNKTEAIAEAERRVRNAGF